MSIKLKCILEGNTDNYAIVNYKKGDSRNMTPTILIDSTVLSIVIIIVLLCSILQQIVYQIDRNINYVFVSKSLLFLAYISIIKI